MLIKQGQTKPMIELQPMVGGAVLWLQVEGNIQDIAAEINKTVGNGRWEVKLSKVRNKRTLDQSGYYWHMVDELAMALRTSVQELHSELLDRYGVLRTTPDGEPVTFTIRADIDPHEVAKYVRVLQRGSIGGKQAIKYGVLKGSSELNTEEFSRLLDGLISECKEVGISTLTPKEIAELEGIRSADKQ